MTRFLLACLVLAGCAAAAPKQQHTYLCDGGRQGMVAFSGESALLTFAGESFELRRVPSASGARYNGVRASVFSRDDEALIEVDGQQLGPCQEIKPKPFG